MAEPTIILSDLRGEHIKNLRKTSKRIRDGKAYRDLSTICVVPTRGSIPARAVESWLSLMPPMNQAFVRMFVAGLEVADAYNKAIDLIQTHPQLKNFKYMLTLEEDNVPPPDGLLKLYESIDEYAIVGGLYFTKGEAGQPMIYGDPKGILSFQPQIPKINKIQECNGVGMGFTLFDLKLFKDDKIPKPWFRTIQEWTPEHGSAQGTQDLYFMGNVRRAGYRIASDNRCLVGHLDPGTGIVW